MSIDITSRIEDFKKAKDTWINSVTNQPEPNNLFELNIGINDISLVFDEVIRLLSLANNNGINPVEWYSLESKLDDAITSVKSPISSNQNIGSMAARQHNIKIFQREKIQKICNSLQYLKNDLTFLVPINPEVKRLSPKLIQEMNAKIAEAKEWFQELNFIKSNVEDVKTNATESAEAIKLDKEQSEKIMGDVRAILDKIKGYERTATTAKENVDSSASTAKTNSDSVATLASELKGSVERKNELFEEFEGYRNRISGLLENANQVGLGRSFQIKRQQCHLMVMFWAIIFGFGIIGLCFLGYKEILPLVNANADLLTIGSHFLLAAPIVWLTWFAARQYGHSSLIYEDYSFKESTAMAFDGYRNEMGQDPEMLKLLQKSAIQNFAADPTRLILKNADPVSPTHALLEKSTKVLKELNLLIKKVNSDKT